MSLDNPIAVTQSTAWNCFDFHRHQLGPLIKGRVQWNVPYPRQKFPIYAAAYLPWQSGGKAIDWISFENVLKRIWECRAIPVVNADTGFAFHPFVAPHKVQILEWINRNFAGRPFVAAVTPPKEKAVTFSADAYNSEIVHAVENGATQIMVMISSGLIALSGQQLIDAYASLSLPENAGILHELTNEFVLFGRQFTPFEFHGILSLPGFGMSKTSDLFGNCMDPRMSLKTDQRMQDVLITSGVDYKIEEAYEICDGILMGAATIWPEMYVLLWRLYQEGKSDHSKWWKFQTLVRNLQSVATHQFMPHADHFVLNGLFDVGGYRHHTAMYLLAQGTITCADQPEGTADFHQRELTMSTIRSFCALIRRTLDKIGEDPNLIPIG